MPKPKPKPEPKPKPQESSVDLSIHNDIGELAIVTEALDELGKLAAVPGKPLTQMHVALDELLSNVIRYAWPEGGPHELQIHIRARSGCMEVVIIDDGRPFDPRSRPAPAPPRPEREPRTGGVGIHMAKQLVDRFEYERVDGRNRLILTKRYASDEAGKQDAAG
jgi:anti-sigma regulatory factor (Ser/Thr protein kinase)